MGKVDLKKSKFESFLQKYSFWVPFSPIQLKKVFGLFSVGPLILNFSTCKSGSSTFSQLIPYTIRVNIPNDASSYNSVDFQLRNSKEWRSQLFWFAMALPKKTFSAKKEIPNAVRLEVFAIHMKINTFIKNKITFNFQIVTDPLRLMPWLAILRLHGWIS